MFVVESDVRPQPLAEAMRSRIKALRWGRKWGVEFEQLGESTPAETFNTLLDATQSAQVRVGWALDALAHGVALTSHQKRLLAREANRTGTVVIMREPASGVGRQAWDRALDDLAVGRRGVTYLGISRGDVDADDVTFYLDAWRQHIERSRELLYKMSCGGWGFPWPKLVLVGERPSSTSDRTRPFSDTSNSDGSTTLTELLDLAEIGERGVYILHAHGAKTRETVAPETFVALNARLVVALGKVAAAHLRSIKVEHVEFPHPKYLHRFEARRLRTRANELAQLYTNATKVKK